MKKLLLLGWFCAVSLFAHPHVFLDTYVDVLPDKIDIRWVFDEMSSSMLMEDYDKNRDKKLDANEVAFMEKTILKHWSLTVILCIFSMEKRSWIFMLFMTLMRSLKRKN